MINFHKYFYKILEKKIKKKTGLHEPFFSLEDIKNVKNCIISSFVSTRGSFTIKLEKKIRQLTKSKFVIATNSGTSALELGLRVIGLKKNDEVLVPSLTFVATVNSIKYCNAIPHFVDSYEKNLGINPLKLEKYLKNICYKKGKYSYNKKTKRRIYAIMPVHVFGMPSDINELLKLAKKYNLKIIEDATESFGSTYKNKQLGTFGDIGVLSFNANKIITSGGGGCVVTNNKKYAQLAYHYSTTSKVKHSWALEHDGLGWNTRMPSINAALAYNSLIKFREIVKKKRIIAKKYFLIFKNTKFKLLKECKDCKSNYWLNTVILNQKQALYKNIILEYCNRRGINCRPAWNLISDMKIYKNCPKDDLSDARDLQKRIINLPSGLKVFN